MMISIPKKYSISTRQQHPQLRVAVADFDCCLITDLLAFAAVGAPLADFVETAGSPATLVLGDGAADEVGPLLRVGLEVLGAVVGVDDGFKEGRVVGIVVGADDGFEEGREVGIEVGADDGFEEGRVVGIEVGAEVGIEVGAEDGFEEGRVVGIEVGAAVGIEVGAEVEIEVGADDGLEEGADDGLEEGAEETAAAQKMESVGISLQMVSLIQLNPSLTRAKPEGTFVGSPSPTKLLTPTCRIDPAIVIIGPPLMIAATNLSDILTEFRQKEESMLTHLNPPCILMWFHLHLRTIRYHRC